MTIPESITSIGRNAFSECRSLPEITIPKGVSSIDNGVFRDCTSLTRVTIPESAASIGEGAFRNCTGLTAISLPEGITSIGVSAFENTGLTKVSIPDGIRSVRESTFKNCTALTDVVLPESVTYIGKYAFSACPLVRVAPVGIQTIDDLAFLDCKNLISVYLPETVVKIGWRAFGNCNRLDYAFYGGSKAQFMDISFPNASGSYGITPVDGLKGADIYCEAVRPLTAPMAEDFVVTDGALTGFLGVPAYDLTSLTGLTAWAACYDREGRLLGMEKCPCEYADLLFSVVYRLGGTIRVEDPAGMTVKAFLLDKECKPVISTCAFPL